MSPDLATIVYTFGILGLLWLERDGETRTSTALWVPICWLWLASSRSVAQWLQMTPQGTIDQYLSEGSPLDRAVYTSLLVLGLIVLTARGQRVLHLLRSNWAIVLFFAYCLLSLLWSDYPDIASKRLTKALGDLVMVLVILTDSDVFGAVKRVLVRSAFTLIPISVLLIKYYPALAKYYGQWDWKAHYSGVATNKNGLGAICLLFGLATVWQLSVAIRDRTGRARTRKLAAHGTILVMVLWLFWMANSMTSLACFLLAVALLIATNLRSIVARRNAIHFVVGLVIAISSSVLFLGLDPGLLEMMGRDPTLTDRTLMWKILIGLSTRPLIGTGFESFWLGPRLQVVWNAFPWQPFEAHNGYIEVFLNLGWIGLVLLGIVLVTGYRRVIRVWRNNLPASNLMLAYFVVGLVYNFTEAAFFRMMAPAWIFLLLSMMATTEAAASQVEPTQDPSANDTDTLLVLAESPQSEEVYC